MITEQGNQKRVIGTLVPGAVFGEMALLEESPRKASVVATDGPVECFVLRKQRVVEVLGDVELFLTRTAFARKDDLTKASVGANLRDIPFITIKEIGLLGQGTFSTVKLARFQDEVVQTPFGLAHDLISIAWVSHSRCLH